MEQTAQTLAVQAMSSVAKMMSTIEEAVGSINMSRVARALSDCISPEEKGKLISLLRELEVK